MPFEVSFGGFFVGISSCQLSILCHILVYFISLFTIQLLLIHPLKLVDCGSAHEVWQHNSPMPHSRRASGTIHASLQERGKLPGSICALAWQSIVQHAADTALWPHVVVSLQRLWQHSGR